MHVWLSPSHLQQWRTSTIAAAMMVLAIYAFALSAMLTSAAAYNHESASSLCMSATNQAQNDRTPADHSPLDQTCQCPAVCHTMAHGLTPPPQSMLSTPVPRTSIDARVAAIAVLSSSRTHTTIRGPP
jgi:hypothetical protein